jgi:hypothetical protein
MSDFIATATCGAATFGKCNAQNERLFRMNAGICAEHALELASLLMASANNLTLLSALHGDDDGSMVWAAHYLGDMAKAIIDDVTAGMGSSLTGGELSASGDII